MVSVKKSLIPLTKPAEHDDHVFWDQLQNTLKSAKPFSASSLHFDRVVSPDLKKNFFIVLFHVYLFFVTMLLLSRRHILSPAELKYVICFRCY